MAPRTRALIVSNSCLILLVGLRTIIASFGSKAPAYPVLPNRNHKNGHKALTHFMPTYLHKQLHVTNNTRRTAKLQSLQQDLCMTFQTHNHCYLHWGPSINRVASAGTYQCSVRALGSTVCGTPRLPSLELLQKTVSCNSLSSTIQQMQLP